MSLIVIYLFMVMHPYGCVVDTIFSKLFWKTTFSRYKIFSIRLSTFSAWFYVNACDEFAPKHLLAKVNWWILADLEMCGHNCSSGNIYSTSFSVETIVSLLLQLELMLDRNCWMEITGVYAGWKFLVTIRSDSWRLLSFLLTSCNTTFHLTWNL